MAEFGAALKVNNPDFYCQNVCGEIGFSIEEWDKARKYCKDAGIVGEQMDRILSPELYPCEHQCVSCINIVLDTQLKNKRIRELQNKLKTK